MLHNPPICLRLSEELLGLRQQKKPKRAAPIRLLALQKARPVCLTGLTGRLQRSDRSGWLISCLGLPNLALREHGPVSVEVLIPLLLFLLLLLFFVAKALQFPLLCMS